MDTAGAADALPGQYACGPGKPARPSKPLSDLRPCSFLRHQRGVVRQWFANHVQLGLVHWNFILEVSHEWAGAITGVRYKDNDDNDCDDDDKQNKKNKKNTKKQKNDDYEDGDDDDYYLSRVSCVETSEMKKH